MSVFRLAVMLPPAADVDEASRTAAGLDRVSKGGSASVWASAVRRSSRDGTALPTTRRWAGPGT